jgi:hypothetical protein
MKLKLTITVLLGLTVGILYHSSVEPELIEGNISGPLKVSVKSLKTRVRIQQPFEIRFEVKNITDTNQQFILCSDDLYSAWRTDNPDVRLFPDQEVWHNNNHQIDMTLAPGESFTKRVKVWTRSSTLTNQTSFRLGFTPFVDRERPYSNRMKRPSYWSNPIQIELEEPPKEIAPFKIIVTPATNQVHRGGTFKVHLAVKNVTDTNQHIDTMSCAWYFNWTTDSLVVDFEPWGCDRNFPTLFDLAPGQSWEKDLDLTASESVTSEKVSFRMGFTPDGMLTPRDPNPEKWKFYWSNFVTMNFISN